MRKDTIERLRQSVYNCISNQTNEVIKEKSNDSPKDTETIVSNTIGISNSWAKNSDYQNSIRDLINITDESLLKHSEEEVSMNAVKKVLKQYLREYSDDYDLDDIFDLYSLWQDIEKDIVEKSGKIIIQNMALANVEKLISLTEKVD